MATPLDMVPGIGPKSAAHLHGLGIASAEELLVAGSAALLGVPGFYEGRANAVLEAAAGLVIASEESTTLSPLPDVDVVGKKGKKGKKKKRNKAEQAQKEKKKGKVKKGKKIKKDKKKRKTKKKKGKKA